MAETTPLLSMADGLCWLWCSELKGLQIPPSSSDKESLEVRESPILQCANW